MDKRCPHCHERSFGWRELLTLDYFSPDECKACGKPVRNDGFRQFLTIPTILAAIFLGIVVFSVMPAAVEPLGFLFIFVLAGLSIIVLAKPVKVEPMEEVLPPFAPNRNNDKVIIVAGWNEEELHKILNDFGVEGGTSPPPKIEVHKSHDRFFRLTFPQDLSPSDYAALVNYLNYPLDIDLATHSIAVVGETTLTSDFQGIPTPFIGKRAILYVPENDYDYTAVYLHVEAGDNFSMSLADPSSIWKGTAPARLSREVERLVS